MLIQKDKALLLLIDVQEKLTPLVQGAENLIKHCQWLLRLVTELNVPLIISEQYPSGLGATLLSLRTLAPSAHYIAKVHFSCYHHPDFIKYLQILNKKQIIIAGIETHVCVLQTAIEMQQAGFEVFVAIDAISSRAAIDHDYGIQRMQQSGVNLVTREMIFFELLKSAKTAQFKALTKIYIN